VMFPTKAEYSAMNSAALAIKARKTANSRNILS
jgi:hypothetical protein